MKVEGNDVISIFDVRLRGVAESIVRVEMDVSELDPNDVEGIAESVRIAAQHKISTGIYARCAGWRQPDSLIIPTAWDAITVGYSEGDPFWVAGPGD